MGHIFISYSHADKDYVYKLHSALQDEGFEAWIDGRIDYGDQWLRVIQKHLDECDAFIIVMSRHSLESDMVQNEITRAREKKKNIFPVLLEGENWLIVQAKQFVDVRDGSLPTEKFYTRLENITQRKKPAPSPEPVVATVPPEQSTSTAVPKPSVPKNSSHYGVIGAGGITILILAWMVFRVIQNNPPSTPTAQPGVTAPETQLIPPAETNLPMATNSATENSVPPSMEVSTEMPVIETATFSPPGLPNIGGADKIAFIANGEIWIMDVDGTNPQKLTDGGGSMSDLQWLPPPHENILIFIRGFEVRFMNIETGEEGVVAQFAAGSSSLNAFRVSRDGKQVMITLNDEIFAVPFDFDNKNLENVDRKSDLLALKGCIYPVDTNDNTQLEVREAVWSENDESVAWFFKGVDRFSSKVIQQVSVLKYPQNCDPQAVTLQDNFPAGRFALGEYQISDIDWNGKELFAFNTSERNYVIDKGWRIGWGDLYSYNWTTKNPAVRINPVNGKCCYRDARWSPDGHYLFFAFQDKTLGAGAPTVLYYVSYSAIVSSTDLTPLQLTSDFFGDRKESTQAALRLAP